MPFQKVDNLPKYPLNCNQNLKIICSDLTFTSLITTFMLLRTSSKKLGNSDEQ